MRRYGGADVPGLAETKNWCDPKSAARYAHVVAPEEWDRVDNLPSVGTRRENLLASESRNEFNARTFLPPGLAATFCTVVRAILPVTGSRRCGLLLRSVSRARSLQKSAVIANVIVRIIKFRGKYQ